MKLTERFQRARWSKTRIAMDAMEKGEILKFPDSEYYNAKASTDRLNDAYDGKRKWKLTRNGSEIVVELTLCEVHEEEPDL